MTILQRPDNISQEEWEEILEDHAERHPTDAWDTLEEIRKLLNPSMLSDMHLIKKTSRYGNQCSYYRKARAIFMRDTAEELFPLLDQLFKELQEDPDYEQR